MPITEGNLFAKMRLTLPEHRAMMDEVHRVMNRNPVPRPAEDAQEQWEHVLRDAALRRLPVRITLFEGGRETYQEGIPVIRGGELRLQGRGAWYRVNVRQITRVEALSYSEWYTASQTRKCENPAVTPTATHPGHTS